MKELRPAPYAAFAEAALEKRGERVPRKPRVNMAGIGELLTSAGRAFPLVTIHREEIDPDACWIGRVLAANRSIVSIREITPAARWESTPEEYALSEITRVGFGADYEGALYLVGGEPPPTSGAKRPARTGRPRTEALTPRSGPVTLD